jgi:hypothetical protein
MIGRTSLVGRDGLVLADLGIRVGVLTADVDLHAGRITHFFFNESHPRTLAVVASRRPELYHDLADTGFRDPALLRIQSSRKRRTHG